MTKSQVLLAVLLTIACGQAPPAEQAASTTPVAPAPQAAASGTDGVQQVNIDVGSEFTPSSVTVRSGVPVRLNFRRGDAPTCADEVVFAELGIKKPLPAGQITTVELTPQKSGELNFACGMNMMKGKLLVN